MITHPRSDADTRIVLKKWVERVKHVPVSILSNPTTMTRQDVQELKDIGADIFTVALDACNREVFDRTRGSGVQSPHSWDKYWEILHAATEIFGPERFGAHLIVGMGESDHDVLTQVQKIRDLGGHSHMFAFFPERGSLMDHLPPAPRPNGGASNSRATSSTIAIIVSSACASMRPARSWTSAYRKMRSMR